MFINLTNHPSSKWDHVQLKAACALGGSVTDYPFPQIPPLADTTEVYKLVTQTLAGMTIFHDDVVHVMGEMGFTYAIVRELKKRGIKVVHSTTERKTIENADGTKTVKFEFVQFRNYSFQ